MRPYQHILAELPGNTPSDLSRFNQDLSADPPKPRSQSVGEVPTQSSFPDIQQASSLSSVISSCPRPMTADPNIEAPRRRPPDVPLPRRSFEHVRPSVSVLDDRARASFDMARPRANSEQLRTRRSFEVRSRASQDQVRPMPTLTERPIERFNSTASVAVGDAVSVPLASMRYRSKPVNVRKPPVKHRSLPSSSELPSFPSQTSLMDDLSTWITPQSAHDSCRSVQSIPGIDTVPSVIESTSATSTTSSPVVPSSPVSCPPVMLDATSFFAPPVSTNPIADQKSVNYSPASAISILTPPSRPAPPPPVTSPPPIPPKIPLNQPPQPPQNFPMAQSKSQENLQRSGSSPIPPPLGRRRRPIPSSKNTINNVDTSIEKGTDAVTRPSSAVPAKTLPSESSALQERPRSPKHQQSAAQKNELHHLTSSASATDKYPISLSASNAPAVPALPTELPQPHAGDTPSRDSQQPVRHTPSTASATDKYPIALSPTSSPPILNTSSQFLPSAANSVETLVNETPSAPTAARPITALAKRRAAHAKRMQMAFGAESENA